MFRRFQRRSGSRFASRGSRSFGSRKRTPRVSRGTNERFSNSFAFEDIDPLNINNLTFATQVFSTGVLRYETELADAARFQSKSVLWLGCDMYWEIAGLLLNQLDFASSLPFIDPPTTCALDFGLFVSDEREITSTDGFSPGFQDTVDWSTTFDDRFATFNLQSWQVNEKFIMRRTLPWAGHSHVQHFDAVPNLENLTLLAHSWRCCRQVKVRAKRWIGDSTAIFLVFETDKWIDSAQLGLVTNSGFEPGSKVAEVDFVHYFWRP